MQKSSNTSLKPLLLLLFSLLLSSCFEPAIVRNEPPGSQNPTFKTIGPLAPDGILEAVTWNLEWYGHPFGPENETLQTQNFLVIMDSLKADLYAFQEVSGDDALKRITSRMEGFSGFTASKMSGSQKTAFIYNTNVIDSLSSGYITEGQESYDWASGRFPFYFKFNYASTDTVITIFAITIHAKCCADRASYRRRKNAAESLHAYLTQHKPKANIIILGDYNDDVIVSIYNEQPSPYKVFAIDSERYKIITKPFSINSRGTTIGYNNPVDHITISRGLFDEYMFGSEEVAVWSAEMVDDYQHTTSDHYPVWAKFEF